MQSMRTNHHFSRGPQTLAYNCSFLNKQRDLKVRVNELCVLSVVGLGV